MKSKRFIITICVLLILAMAVTGCRPAERPVPENTRQQTPDPGQQIPPNEVDNGTTRNMEVENDRTELRNTRSAEGQRDLTDRADKIVKEVVKLEEIRSATVVISENTAVIGVNLRNKETGELDRKLERKIEDVVKQADKDIDRVAVTADPDIFTRIENIAKEAGRGRPLSGFGREIEEIITRIIPKA